VCKLLEKFMRTISLVLLIVFLISVTVSYIILTDSAKGIAKSDLTEMGAEIRELLSYQNKDTSKLRASLYKDYIERTRACAEMINLNPKILENRDELNRICKLIDVDELNVYDEKGILQWGTVPKYYGFDFAASEEEKAFLPGLDNPNFEMVQEPQISGKGVYFQYITVARYDKPGLVQIGMQPKRLDKIIPQVNLLDLLKGMHLSTGERIIIANRSDGAVVGDSGGTVISNSPPVLKFAINKSGDEFVTVEGIKYYYSHIENDGYDIYNLVTKKMMFMQRNLQFSIISISQLLIYSALFFIIKIIFSSWYVK